MIDPAEEILLDVPEERSELPSVSPLEQDSASSRALAFAPSCAQLRAMTPASPLELIEQLGSLLEEVDARAGSDFSGIGLIVTASPGSLPVIALRPTCKMIDDEATATALARISRSSHEHHDGFHLLRPDLKIEKIAQYFSPPIVPLARIDRGKRFGGRYLAALFGSMLPGVLATGICSRDFGVAVFEGGEEKIYRAARESSPGAEKATQ